MSEFLGDPSWQGIGVIASVFFAVLSLFLTSRVKKRVFQNHNSKFEKEYGNPDEVLDNQKVEIFGMVERQLYAGPPNYESIDNGDKPQFYWVLYTNEPVKIIARCMETNELRDLGRSCSFQLVVPQKIYEWKNDVLGKFVKAKGSILIGHNGNHKTKALLKLSSIEVV